MYLRCGIRASQLIIELQKQISLHGDCEVFCGGTDYPEGVARVSYNSKGNPYTPANTFTIR